jgi:hypothetical protein
MKITAHYDFDGDKKKVIDCLVYKSIGNVDYFLETMPDLTYCKLLGRKDEPDGKIHVKLEMCAHGQIPKAAQKLLSPEMLTWQEISYWDPAKEQYHFKIKTKYFTKQFDFTGYWGYKELGNGQTRQFCDSDVNVKVPILGGIIEKAIGPALIKNWDENYVMVKKMYGI